MKTKLLFFSCLLTSSLSTQAATTINILSSSSFGLYQTAAGASLAENSLLRYGVFGVSSYNALNATQKNTYSVVNALFTELGTANVDASGAVLSTGNQFSFPTNGISAGDQLYTWVFNASVATSATEWGIYSSTNSLWQVANDPGVTNLANNNIDQIIVGTNETGNNVLLAPIPEPGTIALLFGFMAFTWVAIRRRK